MKYSKVLTGNELEMVLIDKSLKSSCSMLVMNTAELEGALTSYNN